MARADRSQHRSPNGLAASMTCAVCVLLVSLLAGQPAAAEPKPTTALPDGVTLQSRAAIERGLAYLARVQDRDGSWSNRGGYGRYPVAMTSLAGLALLMDGNTTTQGRYAPQVDRAARYVQRMADASGLIAAPAGEARPMFGHGFAMLFLSQLYGMTEDPERAQQIHDILAAAVTLTAQAQSIHGGWYYTPNSNNDEGSVTITQVQALRSCRNVGVAVPKEVIDRAMQYLADSQNSDGGIRYAVTQPGGQSRAPLTAAAACCWFNAGQYKNPRALRALAYCKDKLSPGQASGGHDYYANLYYSQALYVSGNGYWKEYFPARRDYILIGQRQDGSWYGDGIGDVYGTALALIMLQLPYDQLPIMQR